MPFKLPNRLKNYCLGCKNIASGNFKQRIDLPLGGELGELIESFNEMAEKLEIFEEQNIDELTAEKAKLETLVTTIADGAVLIDNNLHIVLANPNARRFFGWEHLDLNGTNILHVLPGSVSAELTRPLYQVAAGKLEGEEFRITLSQPIHRTIRISLNGPVFIKHFKGFLFIITHQCRVPDNIGKHDGSELTGLRHGFIPDLLGCLFFLSAS